MSSEGTRWALKLGAVHLIFHPNAVSEPTSIVVYRWKSSVCSPPLQEHEAIVSNVIELSSLDGIFTPGKEFFKLLFGVKITPQKITPLQGVKLTPLEELL